MYENAKGLVPPSSEKPVLAVRPLAPVPSMMRLLDIVIAMVAIFVLLPLLLLVAVTIWATDPGPVFFAHRRIGLGGIAFPCLKFRTMVTDAEERLAYILSSDADARLEWARERKLRVDPRVTAIGRFLRRSSIDELPQLLNVLRGDMSIVGPRPIVDSERELYGRGFISYCRVKPGITGLWQVSGRNDVPYRRRVALDVLYARRKSVRFDLWILVRTVPAVLSARGCY